MTRVAPLLLVLVVTVVGVAWWVERGESPPHVGRAHAHQAPTEESLGPGLHLAGSGSNLVVTRALAAAYRRARPDERVVVHDSIGSTGGIRAVIDGVIGIGLIARPLQPHERARELSVVAYARVPITLLAHPDVRDTAISSHELLSSLRGQDARWGDGSPRVWLLRERGDAGSTVVGRHVRGFAEASEAAVSARRYRVVYHDDELTRALLGLPGSIGIADLPQARANAPTARILALDGREPTVEAVRAGTYPLFKDLSFVVRDMTDPSVARFLAFAATDEGRAVIEATGAVPLPLEAPGGS